MTDDITLVIVSDLHVNSTVALCPPRFEKSDGDYVKLSRVQRAILECWIDLWEYRVPQLPGEKILAVNGDAGELDARGRSDQLHTRNKADIKGMLLEVLEWPRRVVRAEIFGRGTAAHTGDSAWLEETIARDALDAIRPDGKPPGSNDGQASWWIFRQVVNGTPLDMTHHHQGGATLGACERKAKEMIMDYAVMGEPPPKIAIRSHVHTYLDTHDALPVRYIVTPAWQLKTEYAHRIGKSNKVADVGAVAVTFRRDKTFRVEPIIYRPKAERVWQNLKLT